MAVDGVVEIERHESRTVYRDVVYAAIRGFRPLLLDLTVPVSAGPVPVVMYIHGRRELTGSVGTTGVDSSIRAGVSWYQPRHATASRLVSAYRQAGPQIELVPVDGAGHGFPGINLGALLDRSADFLAHHLAAS